MDKQKLCDSFYDIGNLVTISIAMPAADWQAIKSAQPRGGTCNFEYAGDRYDWYKTTSVTISGTTFPTKATTFSNPGIIKKSFCGSFSTTKPALRLDFAHYVPGNEATVEALIGTQHITLNNCVQDDSYIRQPLGYNLLKQAGLPYARCNFAKVVVNGVSAGIYVNLEPMKKRFVQHNFNGNDKGNAYEIEAGEDLTTAIIDAKRISFEGFSSYSDLKDLRFAATQIASGGLTAAKQVIDFDQFIKFSAMETLLKHWDGYTNNKNNTYLYNDTKAVANPGAGNVKFKFIPSGIDQILKPDTDFHIAGNAVLPALVRADKTATASLFSAIRNYGNTIFDKENHDKVIKPLIDKMETLLKTAGVTNISDKIKVVRSQVKLIKSGAFQLIGEFPTDPSLWLSRTTDDCIHVTNDEWVTQEPDFQREVSHCPPTGGKGDLWWVHPAYPIPNTYKFRSYEFGSWLHGDKVIKTASGKANNIYAFWDNADFMNDFAFEHIGTRQWHASGYFKLQCVPTKQYVYFSETDLTPKGRKDVCQTVKAEDATVLYLF